jgi:hypothetical protein
MAVSRLDAARAAMQAFEVAPSARTLASLQQATAPVLDQLRCAGDWEEWAARNKRAIVRLKREAREAEAAANAEAGEEERRVNKAAIAEVQAQLQREYQDRIRGRRKERAP